MLSKDTYTEPERALLLAIIDQRYDQIDAALAAGASPSLAIEGVPIICMLAFRGEADAIKLLIRAGCNPSQIDSNGRSPLMHAAMGPPSENHAKCIEVLVQAAGPSELQRVDRDGLTASDLAKRYLNAPQTWTLVRMHAPHRTRLSPWLAKKVFFRGAR